MCCCRYGCRCCVSCPSTFSVLLHTASSSFSNIYCGHPILWGLIRAGDLFITSSALQFLENHAGLIFCNTISDTISTCHGPPPENALFLAVMLRHTFYEQVRERSSCATFVSHEPDRSDIVFVTKRHSHCSKTTRHLEFEKIQFLRLLILFQLRLSTRTMSAVDC